MYTGEEPSVGDSNLALNSWIVATTTTPVSINIMRQRRLLSRAEDWVGREVLGRVDDSKTECGAAVAVLSCPLGEC